MKQTWVGYTVVDQLLDIMAAALHNILLEF